MMDETPSASGAKPGRRRSATVGSAVLTPPTGLPTVRNPAHQDVPPTAAVPAPSRREERTPVVPPPARPVVVKPCACGHAREAHEHYRAGSDCGVCGATGPGACVAYRRRGGPVRRLLRKLGLLD